MDRIDILLRAVGRIEGKMQELPGLSRRVSYLEKWLSWLKGGWAAVLAMYVFVCRALYGR
jgi:hypothetical protein